jgi:hypothetical protein
MKEKNKQNNAFIMPRGFQIEINGGGKNTSVSLNGVIAILEIGDNECLFKVRGNRIAVRGSSLKVSVFENGSVDIKGKIDGVSLI